MERITITVKIWKWSGDMGWHFVTLPREYYESIRNTYPRGMVHVTTTIEGTSWDTALFPHIKSKSFILPIKKTIRKAEHLFAGEEITITIVFKK